MKNEKENNRDVKLGAAYIRESTEGQDEGYSPKKQENDIREYAKKHNIKIAKTYKDLISGTDASKREDFQRMIDDALAGEFEVILVFHSSRFARNIAESRAYKDNLRKKGIDVISVSQGKIDYDTPSGFLNEGINELFDEYYSKQLSFWMRSALMEKRKQGFAPGNPPLGYYKKKGNTKEWFVDDDEKQIVQEAFKMYATGKYSMVDVAKHLNDKGYVTKYKNAFTVSAMKGLLQNKAYVGLIHSPKRGYPELPGNHKPIVKKELFDKVQRQIDERRHKYGRSVAKHRFYLLQGLVYCHHCAKHAKGKPDDTHRFMPNMYCYAQPNRKGGEYTYYACKFRKENHSCKQASVRCDVIDKQVIKYLENFELPDEIILKILKKMEDMFDNHQDDGETVKKIKKLKNKKDKLNYMFANTDELSPEDYKSQIKELDAELKELQKGSGMITGYKSKKNAVLRATEAYLRHFPDFWHGNISDEERRNWIQMTIKRVWVKGNKVVAIEPRDEFKAMYSSLKVFGRSPLVAQNKGNS